MTNTEFLALEFGSVVFNKDGVKGVVINIFSDNDVSVLFDTTTGSDRIRLAKFDEADALFLEKPKKKVKKEIVGYASIHELSDAFNKSIILSERQYVNDVLVTLTYETEE